MHAPGQPDASVPDTQVTFHFGGNSGSGTTAPRLRESFHSVRDGVGRRIAKVALDATLPPHQ
jgi:hypothetical protein